MKFYTVLWSAIELCISQTQRSENQQGMVNTLGRDLNHRLVSASFQSDLQRGQMDLSYYSMLNPVLG
jgi:hypothetical protein